MRFSGERQVGATVAEVWARLHDHDALRRVIPGCQDLTPIDGGLCAATLQARVGPVADTYRGHFSISDLAAGTRLRVRVRARGRCGRLEVDLRVELDEGARPGTTNLRYDAEASVGGLVARLGTPALTVAGHHFTGGFFRDLDRAVRSGVPRRALAPLG
jgi:hypothetical protein